MIRKSFFASILLLLSACSTESSYDTPTSDIPVNTDRREVLLILNNKLKVNSHSPRAIATIEENTISTLDVYIFGSAEENGTYTFQQRFAYRSDEAAGSVQLPEGAEELQLSAANDEGKNVTTGLLSIKRGLFVKLYCIANDTTLINPATGKMMKAKDFIPVQFNQTDGKASIANIGVPLEQDFLKFHTALFNGEKPTDTKGEVLLTPLAMSGSLNTPLDLTDPQNSSRLQMRLRLTRLAARFDIVNNAQDSRFTIQSVSMGNARRGAYFFPIAIHGEKPAKDGELVTLTERSFNGNNANQGLSTGAFYSYPSPQDDNAYLILKGNYRVNETENKEVSYQIPFRRKDPDGTEPRLEINSNHRYTIGITRADDYHLDFTLNVADWADDGNIDHYDPENRFDPLLINNLLPSGSTEYEPASRTVTMCLDIKQECSFTIHTASNIQLKAELDYPLISNPKLHWLILEEQTPDPEYKHQGSIAVKYKVSLDTQFTGTEYPSAILRISDNGGVHSERIVINPQPYPVPAPTPPFTPSVVNELNRFNAADTLLYLYRVTGSTLPLRLICADGVTPPENTDWYTIERQGGIETAPQFTLTLTDRSVALPDDCTTLVFRNKKWPHLTMPMKVQLMEAELTNPKLESGEENAALDASAQTVTLKMRQGSKCKISMEAYKEAKVSNVEYEKSPLGKPSDDWLVYTGKPAPESIGNRTTEMENQSAASVATGTSEQYSSWNTENGINGLGATSRAVTLPSKHRKEIEFSMQKDANIKYFGRAKVTVTNTCLGPDEVYYVDPEYLVPTITEAKPMVPDLNNYDAATKTIYMVQQAEGGISQASISIYAPGGSKLELPDGLTANLTESETQTQLYTLQWAGTNNKETDRTLTLKVINKSDPEKIETLSVKALASDISDMALNSKTSGSASLSADRKTVTVDIVSGNWFRLNMKAFGIDTRVSVISHPAWLQAGTPSARTAPVKEDTYIVFTVDGTKTDFSEGDIVLKNPVGGPNYTIRVKPQYMKPSLTANPAGFSANSSWSGGYINLVQMRTGQATATAKIYSLGGSKGQILTARSGLSMTQTALTAATNRDYPIQWAATNATLNDQTTTLRIYNHDSSQYLDIPIRMVSNGALDIKTNLGYWSPNPTMGGKKLRLTVGMEVPIEENKSFNMQIYAYGGTDIINNNVGWLTCSPTESNTNAAYPTYAITTLNFKVKSINGSYTAKTFTVRPKRGGPDLVVTVKPLYRAPAIIASSGMNPSLNNWDSNQNTLYLLQKPQGQTSVGTLTVKSFGGSKLSVPAGITASKTSSTNITDTYEIRWTGSNAVQSETTKTLRIMNNSDNSKYKDISVKLLPNTLNDVKLTAQNGGISLSGYNGTTATLTMPIIKDRQFTISMQSYGGQPSVSKKPAWLQQTGSTRAAPSRGTYTFTYKLIEDATDFNDTQLVFANPGGGPAVTVTISRVFQKPVIYAEAGSTPSCNGYTSGNLYLYRAANGQQSKGRLRVYALGGSSAEITDTSIGISNYKTEKKKNFYYEMNKAGDSQLRNNTATATLKIWNADKTSSESVTVRLESSVPTFQSYNSDAWKRTAISASKQWDQADIHLQDHAWNYGKRDFYFLVTSPLPFTVSTSESGGKLNRNASFSIYQAWDANTKQSVVKMTLKAQQWLRPGHNMWYGLITPNEAQLGTYLMDMYIDLPVAEGITCNKINDGGEFWLATTNRYSHNQDEACNIMYNVAEVKAVGGWESIGNEYTAASNFRKLTFPSLWVEEYKGERRWTRDKTNNAFFYTRRYIIIRDYGDAYNEDRKSDTSYNPVLRHPVNGTWASGNNYQP